VEEYTMLLAEEILSITEDSKRESIEKYKSLEGFRYPFIPFQEKDWEELSRKLTERWVRDYHVCFNFSDFHFIEERAPFKSLVQPPVVERMVNLAFESNVNRRSIFKLLTLWNDIENRFGSRDADRPRSGRDYSKLGGIVIQSVCLNAVVASTITNEMPVWATERASRCVKFLTCSEGVKFHRHPDALFIQVESMNSEIFFVE
jgi:hypothetical protein